MDTDTNRVDFGFSKQAISTPTISISELDEKMQSNHRSLQLAMPFDAIYRK
jgi:hypothetical protein